MEALQRKFVLQKETLKNIDLDAQRRIQGGMSGEATVIATPTSLAATDTPIPVTDVAACVTVSIVAATYGFGCTMTDSCSCTCYPSCEGTCWGESCVCTLSGLWPVC